MSPVPLRLIIEMVTDKPCEEPECVGEKAHTFKSYTYRLVDGTIVEDLKVGDVYLSIRETGHTCPWTNCDGKHLICLVPGKVPNTGKEYIHRWNVDGRASNCTMPEDTVHRCWIKHGDIAKPYTLHVDKSGNTCKAGAGSIQVQGWHGYLDKGYVSENRR
jgi:hypothetical protein